MGSRLSELAQMIRSKNAGPFVLTFDVLFGDQATFERVRRSGRVTAASIAALYKLRPETVQLIEYPSAMAFKATIPRPVISGDPDDGDIYGCQQFGPLADLMIPVE